MRRRLAPATAVLAVSFFLLSSFLVSVARDAVLAAAAPVKTAPPVSRPSTGYWLTAADGGVFTYGDAEFHGSAGDVALRRPIVGMAATSSGSGYWMVSSDGGVFAFGRVLYHGSMGGQPLNRPIVGMAATPTGGGYWLVASDGGIFAFGDAGYFGSTGDIKLNQPIVGMTATPSGQGYWLVARDGGIFTFGDAEFFGSTGDIKLNQPIVTMASTTSGDGYWLAAADGGMFTFGDAEFLGSTGSIKLNKPIVGMTPTGLGNGYWLVASDGGIFTFGDAPFLGSAGGAPLNSPIVAMAPRPKPGRVESAIFYYPWYGSAGDRPEWYHWANNRHEPPADIAANFYPSRGPYSSSDFSILQQHMADIRSAGVDTVVVSWWGPGSYEDRQLAGVLSAAQGHGLRVAVHLEPYDGRTPETVAARRAGAVDAVGHPRVLDLPVGRAGARGVAVADVDVPGLHVLGAGPLAVQRRAWPVPDVRRPRRVRRRLHVRPRPLHAGAVRDLLRAGAGPFAAVLAVGVAGLRRPARRARQHRAPAWRRRAVRRVVDGSVRLGGRRHLDHVVQRVARGDPDRAGRRRAVRPVGGAGRGAVLLLVLRGRLRRVGRGRRVRVPQADPVLDRRPAALSLVSSGRAPGP